MAGPSFEYRTRVNAFNALRELNYLDTRFALHLCNALLHPNNRLRAPAEETIRYLLGQTAHRKLYTTILGSNTWTQQQRETLSRVLQPE
jgi:hypothetical protein